MVIFFHMKNDLSDGSTHKTVDSIFRPANELIISVREKRRGFKGTAGTGTFCRFGEEKEKDGGEHR